MSELAEVRRVAVVDDNPEDAATLAICVEDCELEPVQVTEFSNLADLIEEVRRGSDAAICDHRFTEWPNARFSGAEAVARLFDLGVPAVLVTQFTLDADTSIRQWRRKIPVVLPREQITPEAIQDGFIQCQEEWKHRPLPSRIPRRAIVRVVGMTSDTGMPVLDALVPQWRPKEAVRLPVALLGDIADDVHEGMRLIADVNIGALSADDLFFDNFELAPEPDEDDGLA